MATTEVDTKAAVSKYLARQTTGVRLNADGDTAEENTAVLESIGISFLLTPQVALTFILRTKNTLQQLIASDIELIDYIVEAVGEISNPNIAVKDTSDLIEAQTALVELDRIGSVNTDSQAYGRYVAAVNRFMNNHLATSLKRRGTGQFERSGIEAKTDLFNAVGLFNRLHPLVAERVNQLAGAVLDFESVDLTRVVSATTLGRVRSSLDAIKSGMDQNTLSKITAGIELLAGSASLQAISNARKVFDPTLATLVFPDSRDITTQPESAMATVTGTRVEPFIPPPGAGNKLTFVLPGPATTDVNLPIASRFGCPYLPAREADVAGAFNIPAGYKLYIRLVPGPAPDAGDGATHIDVSLPSGGSVSPATVRSAINTALSSAGTCELLGTRFVLTGNSTDTSIYILTIGPGSFLGGVWTPDAPSGHAILGFDQQVVGNAPGFFPGEFVVDRVNGTVAGISADLVDGRLRFTATDTNPATSAFTLSNFQSEFGFTPMPQTHIAAPKAMLLMESGLSIDPASVDILPGSIFHAGSFVAPIVSIDGNRLLFGDSVTLPLSPSAVLIDSPAVEAVRRLMTVLGLYAGSFDSDVLPLLQVLSPLLSTPTLAQVNDALRVFSSIREKLNTLRGILVGIVVRDDQQPAASTASSILLTLGERGLDRAQEFLTRSLFSDFFDLDSQSASKGSQFLKTMETVVQSDLATSTIEADQPDGNLPSGENPDSLLTRKNVP